MGDPDTRLLSVDEMVDLLADLQAQAEQARFLAAREINRCSETIASSFIELMQLTEIRCDPEDRRGAELAKRQLIASMRNYADLMRDRFAE